MKQLLLRFLSEKSGSISGVQLELHGMRHRQQFTKLAVQCVVEFCQIHFEAVLQICFEDISPIGFGATNHDGIHCLFYRESERLVNEVSVALCLGQAMEFASRHRGNAIRLIIPTKCE